MLNESRYFALTRLYSKLRVLRVYPPFIRSLLPKNSLSYKARKRKRRNNERRIIELSPGNVFIYLFVIADRKSQIDEG